MLTFEICTSCSLYSFPSYKDNCCCCSVAKSHPALFNPMNCSMPGFPILQYLLEFAQTHIHWVSDIIQPCHPLLPPSPSAFNPSQHQGLFQWVSSSHQVTKYWSFSFSIGSSSKYSELISLNLHPLDQKSQNKDSNPSFAMIVLIGKWRMEILS